MLDWGLLIVEMGRSRYLDVFVAVEMYLFVASDILRLTGQVFQFEEKRACLYRQA